jgi:four helix bundle protein
MSIMRKINDFRMLVAWQLAEELADLVDAMIASEPASRNRGFCDQIQKSSAKAGPQIAEGFARFRPKESAHYYRIARASLAETRSHLIRGFRRNYWPEDVFRKAMAVSQSAFNTTGGLLQSRLAKIRQEEEEARRKRRKGGDSRANDAT